MKAITFTLKTVTPMYNGRDLEFERNFALLPQSIRGVMRFWFRAILPRVIDVKKDKYKTMREIESFIFGSTEKKSAFDVVVRSTNIYHSENSNKEYATYGVDERRYLREGSKINFEIVIKKDYFHLEDLLIEIVNVISEFGGIGAKTSNGFGSFEIKDIKLKKLKEDKEENVKIVRENILKETDEIMKKFLKENNFKVNFHPTDFGQVADYPTLVEGQYKIFLGKKSFGNYNELKDFLFSTNKNSKGKYILTKSALRGTDFKKMLSKFKFTPNEIKEEYNNFPNAKFKDAVFGLPMNFFVKEKMKPYYFKHNNFFSLKSEEKRKTSQIKIKVYKVNERFYYKVILIKSKINNSQSDSVHLRFTGNGMNRHINNNVNDFYQGLEEVMKDNDLIVEGGK